MPTAQYFKTCASIIDVIRMYIHFINNKNIESLL